MPNSHPSAEVGGVPKSSTPPTEKRQPHTLILPLCLSFPMQGGTVGAPKPLFFVGGVGGGRGARLTCGWRCGCCCGPCPGTSPGGGRSGRRRCCGCSWGTRTPCSSTGCRPARRCPRRAGPRSLREEHASDPTPSIKTPPTPPPRCRDDTGHPPPSSSPLGHPSLCRPSVWHRGPETRSSAAGGPGGRGCLFSPHPPPGQITTPWGDISAVQVTPGVYKTAQAHPGTAKGTLRP